jgi:hypothetical protein
VLHHLDAVRGLRHPVAGVQDRPTAMRTPRPLQAVHLRGAADQRHHLVARGHEGLRQLSADEAAATGEEDLHTALR